MPVKHAGACVRCQSRDGSVDVHACRGRGCLLWHRLARGPAGRPAAPGGPLQPVNASSTRRARATATAWRAHVCPMRPSPRDGALSGISNFQPSSSIKHFFSSERVFSGCFILGAIRLTRWPAAGAAGSGCGHLGGVSCPRATAPQQRPTSTHACCREADWPSARSRQRAGQPPRWVPSQD